MAEHSDTRLHPDGFMDLFPDLHRASGAFSHDDHKMGISRKARRPDSLHHIPLEVNLMLRHQHRRCADGNPDIQRQEARMPAHNLHYGAAFM